MKNQSLPNAMHQHQFRFTHIRNGDTRMVGELPVPTTPERVVYAYEDPRRGGQAFERPRDEFYRMFRPI